MIDFFFLFASLPVIPLSNGYLNVWQATQVTAEIYVSREQLTRVNN